MEETNWPPKNVRFKEYFKLLCFSAGFDKYPLVLADNHKTHQFYVPLDSPKVDSLEMQRYIFYFSDHKI